MKLNFPEFDKFESSNSVVDRTQDLALVFYYRGNIVHFMNAAATIIQLPVDCSYKIPTG